jgi:hypothetical protein
MDSSTITTEQIREAFDDIIPDPEDKRMMCSQLLRTISYCREIGSEAWSVSLLDAGFRVNVGQVEVMTCFYMRWDRQEFEIETDQGWLNFRLLISGPDARKLIESCPEYITSAVYRSVREPHWVLHEVLHVEGERDDVERVRTLARIDAAQRAHRHFVAAAAHSPNGTLRKRSNFARFHCEAIVAYARDIVNMQDVMRVA